MQDETVNDTPETTAPEATPVPTVPLVQTRLEQAAYYLRSGTWVYGWLFLVLMLLGLMPHVFEWLGVETSAEFFDWVYLIGWGGLAALPVMGLALFALCVLLWVLLAIFGGNRRRLALAAGKMAGLSLVALVLFVLLSADRLRNEGTPSVFTDPKAVLADMMSADAPAILPGPDEPLPEGDEPILRTHDLFMRGSGE